MHKKILPIIAFTLLQSTSLFSQISPLKSDILNTDAIFIRNRGATSGKEGGSSSLEAKRGMWGMIPRTELTESYFDFTFNNAIMSLVGSNGNVGIGNMYPTSRLEIDSKIYNDSGLKFSNFNSSTPAVMGAKPLGVDSAGKVVIADLSSSSGWSLSGNAGTSPPTNFIGTTDSSPLVFKTDNVERLKVMTNGQFVFKSKSSGDSYDFINESSEIGDGGDVVWIKSGYPQSKDVGLLTISSSNWLYPVFSARENGRVFIGINGYNYKTVGCADCNQYRLFVKDGIKTEKIKVDVASANGWADYVLKEDYPLPPLSAVEAHIKEKGHLLNIPSAADVVRDGINLGEMDAKLLSKIEELTLYIIDLDKRNRSLENSNKELRSAISDLTERIRVSENHNKR